MSSQTFFQSLIVLHLTGFLLFAGTTIADFIAFKQFWKQYNLTNTGATTVLGAMAGFPQLMRVGMGLIILSGIGIMAMTHAIFGEQVWFRVKFGIVIVVIINAFVIGQRLRSRLKKALAEEAAPQPGIISRIKTNLNRFHTVQLLLIFVIIVLSIFKFN